MTFPLPSWNAVCVAAWLAAALSPCALALDLRSEHLFAVDNHNGRLYLLDRSNGSASEVGRIGYENVRDLAYDKRRHRLIGTDTVTDELIRIDLVTGRGQPLARLKSKQDLFLASIDINPADGELYGVEYNSGQLYHIAIQSGEMRPLFRLPAPFGQHGVIAFAPDGTLFVGDQASGALARVHLPTGSLSSVGTLSPRVHLTGLSFHADGALYGIDASRLALLTLSSTTAAVSLMPPHGVLFIVAIAAYDRR